MGRVIKRFQDGSFLEYDRGSFDDWCVYLTASGGERKPPKDEDYFQQLKRFADKYGAERVYSDYVRVYSLTGKEAEASALDAITGIAAAYGGDALEMDIILSILYMAMISEERKAFTRLGKRIKRLGIHKLLLENYSAADAASFMRGMGWRDIAELCRERGF